MNNHLKSKSFIFFVLILIGMLIHIPYTVHASGCEFTQKYFVHSGQLAENSGNGEPVEIILETTPECVGRTFSASIININDYDSSLYSSSYHYKVEKKSNDFVIPATKSVLVKFGGGRSCNQIKDPDCKFAFILQEKIGTTYQSIFNSKDAVMGSYWFNAGVTSKDFTFISTTPRNITGTTSICTINEAYWGHRTLTADYTNDLAPVYPSETFYITGNDVCKNKTITAQVKNSSGTRVAQTPISFGNSNRVNLVAERIGTEGCNTSSNPDCNFHISLLNTNGTEIYNSDGKVNGAKYGNLTFNVASGVPMSINWSLGTHQVASPAPINSKPVAVSNTNTNTNTDVTTNTNTNTDVTINTDTNTDVTSDTKITSIVKLRNPLKDGLDTIPKIVAAILEGIVLPIAVPLFAIMLIYSGILFVLAQGNPEKIKNAKNTLKWTLIGGAVILGAYVIAEAIQSTIGAIVQK